MFLLPALLTASVILAQASSGEDPPGAVDVDTTLGKGVAIRNDSEGFELMLRGRIHVLSEWTESDAGDTPLEPEVSLHRMRLLISGRVAHDFRFYVHLGFASDDFETGIASPARDVYATWTRFRDVNVRVGQWKVPYDRQQITSSSALELVDRSIVVKELTLDRDVGVSLMSDDFLGLDHLLAYQVGVFGTEGKNRPQRAHGRLDTARLELLPLGSFDATREGDLQRTPQPRVAFGLAYGRTSGTQRDAVTHGDFYSAGTLGYRHATADAHFKWKGFSMIAAWLWRRGDRAVVDVDATTGAEEFSRSGWGWFAQTGYFVARPVELVARYSELRPMHADRSSLSRRRELGGGANWFLHGRALNIQADYVHLFEDGLAQGADALLVQTQMNF